MEREGHTEVYLKTRIEEKEKINQISETDLVKSSWFSEDASS